MNEKSPNLALRDLAGLTGILLLAIALVVAAFVTGAGPFILIALLIGLIFALFRSFRERGREAEAKEAAQALRTRLHKGERLLAVTVGDRRRVKPLATLFDFFLMMFTQGLAAGGAGAVAVDDTFVGLTNRRLIVIDRYRRPLGEKRGWRERLNLRRRNGSQGKHAVIFEAPYDGLLLSVRLAIFYLARLNVQGADGRAFSIGLNSRFWAERAVALSQTHAQTLSQPI
jgi:hypothetical protein